MTGVQALPLRRALAYDGERTRPRVIRSSRALCRAALDRYRRMTKGERPGPFSRRAWPLILFALADQRRKILENASRAMLSIGVMSLGSLVPIEKSARRAASERRDLTPPSS